jgi:hypothetical protein
VKVTTLLLLLLPVAIDRSPCSSTDWTPPSDSGVLRPVDQALFLDPAFAPVAPDISRIIFGII